MIDTADRLTTYRDKLVRSYEKYQDPELLSKIAEVSSKRNLVYEKQKDAHICKNCRYFVCHEGFCESMESGKTFVRENQHCQNFKR